MVTFDEHTVQFFEHVKIGRSSPQLFKTRQNSDDTKIINLDSVQMKEMPQKEDCGKNLNVLEPNAAKFGDVKNSHVAYTLRETFWKKDYVIEFEFRTFYKNGMLYVTKVVATKIAVPYKYTPFLQGPRDHYNLLEIKDGKVQLEVNGKRKKKLVVEHVVNDGAWHRILIEQITNKKKRKISILIDQNMTVKKQTKIPQNKVGPNLYIGGIPENLQVSFAI